VDGVPGGYEFNIAQYGVKWPMGYALEVGDCGPDFMEVHFDTPWSPPDGQVFEALSRHFSVTAEHWYAESGCNFCGFAVYLCDDDVVVCGLFCPVNHHDVAIKQAEILHAVAAGAHEESRRAPANAEFVEVELFST
jgi:hypothetical protein